MRLIIGFFIIHSFFQSNPLEEKDRITFADNVVVAHRGAWKQKDIPENSIASLKHAIELNCTGSEFDVRMTADDILIVNHDAIITGW
jgi:glycerophosphoryl diester phosphodiesterase